MSDKSGRLDELETRIIRSRKRRKTVQAREADGVIEILAPAVMSDEELLPYIKKLKERLGRRNQKDILDDYALEKRAKALNRKYFGGLLRWGSIRWTTNQNRRWGSCAPVNGSVRISHRLATMPGFVLDYVLIHELAHLIEANHGKQFWNLVYRYPKTERARGFLMGAGYENPE
ncbi:uncharacterized protein METZ01_LOCUS174640 [marine metagenome]|uniref:YgjP-like metallopeptidase domain-containing protein n=1 Tax=marine metagenome TaxID=408172 RepID=A0A382C6T4_9ZZZZ